MASILVIYKKETHGFNYVSSMRLDSLIIGDKITHSYRPAENRWISAKLDPVKGSGGLYQGPERRKIISNSVEKAHKTRKDERNRSSNWLDILLHIGNI